MCLCRVDMHVVFILSSRHTPSAHPSTSAARSKVYKGQKDNRGAPIMPLLVWVTTPPPNLAVHIKTKAKAVNVYEQPAAQSYPPSV